MAVAAPRAPLSVYMLADHLDAALAAGEDLTARGQDWRQLVDAPGNMQTFPARQREIVDEIRAFELTVIARILKARDHARALSAADARFSAIANLFASGTALLMDAVEECGDATTADFDTGDGITAYVRSRGLIPAETPAITNAAQLTIDDTFLIARRIQLGALMDMAAAFLDALEAQYELFSSDATTPERTELDVSDVDGSAAVEHPAAGATSAKVPQESRLAKLTAEITGRREFGQRNRTPLN